MPLAINLPARKSVTWHAILDMPVRLMQPRDASGESRGRLIFGQQDTGHDTRPGWLVLLDVSNTGGSPIRSADFTAPLSFTFPGRQVVASWVSHEPTGRRSGRTAPGSGLYSLPCPAEPERVQLAGHFLLRSAAGYGITVVLTGTPVAGYQSPIRLDGALARGRVSSPRPL